jgi:HAMP domain-containing protein
MSRVTAIRLRTKLRALLVAVAVVLFIPVLAATLHLARVMDLNRRLAQLEASQAGSPAPVAVVMQKRISELRHQMEWLGDRAFRDVVTLAALGLVAVVITALVAPPRLLRPLARLGKLIRQTEGGNLRAVVDRIDPDEVGDLTRRLQRMLQELERFDELKREKITGLAAQRDQLLELLGVPAAIVDPRGRLLRASSGFRKAFAVEEEQLHDRPLLSTMGWEDSGLATLLATSEEVAEADAELSGKRYRVRGLLAASGEGASHRLLLFR